MSYRVVGAPSVLHAPRRGAGDGPAPRRVPAASAAGELGCGEPLGRKGPTALGVRHERRGQWEAAPWRSHSSESTRPRLLAVWCTPSIHCLSGSPVFQSFVSCLGLYSWQPPHPLRGSRRTPFVAAAAPPSWQPPAPLGGRQAHVATSTPRSGHPHMSVVFMHVVDREVMPARTSTRRAWARLGRPAGQGACRWVLAAATCAWVR